MKRFLAGFLTLVLLLTGITLAASADTWEDFDAHLKYEGDKVYYIESDGSVFKGGWKKTVITKTWTDEDGSTYTNTYDNWIYAKEDGALAKDEWLELGGKWYYFGWVQMATGTIQVKDTYYLLGQDGAWTGASAKNAGWVKSGNDWYYLEIYSNEDYSDGYFYWDGTAKIDDTLYFFDKTGKLASAGWQKTSWTDYSDGTTYNTWYYVYSDGTAATGWKQIDGTWYYFSDWGSMARDGVWWMEDESKYAFRSSGALVEDGWYKQSWTYEGETYSNWYYAGKDGKLVTGWKQIDGTWYYFWDGGSMAQNSWLCTDDEGKTWYYFDKNGAMVSGGWQKIDDYWFYFDKDGVQVMNSWVKDGDSWYYVEDSMLKDGTFTIEGKEYTFDANGVWIK